MSDERLHEYLDGQLPPEEKARFERELAADPRLSDRLRELRELDLALGMLPGHSAPPDFTARVARAARRRRPGAILRLVVPFAAAAGVLVAVFLSTRPTAPPPAQEAAAYIWESDVETYGSLALTDLEDEILREIEGT
jgi:anti-sigma factor RsiW